MQQGFAIQSWCLYAVGVSLICSRIIFRRITLGCFRKAQADDWLMVLVLLPYTASIVIANRISNERTVQDRKFRYALEELQIITMWLVKACLLVLYWRIFPTESQLWKRRTLQSLTALCCTSFLIVQISLLASCQSIQARWDPRDNSSQCSTYQTHTSIILPFNILTTLFILLLPIPFISTPRKLLQIILLMLGTLTLIAGIIGRVDILTKPTSTSYLPWYTAESSLFILFANLPFLTSLVVATAPARIRKFSASHHLATAQWPRSRQQSRHNSVYILSARSSRLGSVGTTTTKGGYPGSPIDEEKVGLFGNYKARYTERVRSYSGGSGTISPKRRMSIFEKDIPDGIMPAPPTPPVPMSPTRAMTSPLPKTRLSGGLAEMDDACSPASEHFPTSAWPITWK